MELAVLGDRICTLGPSNSGKRRSEFAIGDWSADQTAHSRKSAYI